MESSKVEKNEGSALSTLSRKLNCVLISVTGLELNGKDPDEISLQYLFGNLDGWGYLILFISLVGILGMSLLSAILFLSIFYESLLFVYPAAVIGVLSGILLFYCLFRLRRWLKS